MGRSAIVALRSERTHGWGRTLEGMGGERNDPAGIDNKWLLHGSFALLIGVSDRIDDVLGRELHDWRIQETGMHTMTRNGRGTGTLVLWLNTLKYTIRRYWNE